MELIIWLESWKSRELWMMLLIKPNPGNWLKFSILLNVGWLLCQTAQTEPTSTNSGVGVLALGGDGIQKLWKWGRSEHNPSGKVAVLCIALSKNDSYVMSACGGKVSLFNMTTFKVMTTVMPPLPASTCLAFHPQDNNITATGNEDSTIHIYNVSVDEVKSKLKGRQKRLNWLIFFHQSLNVGFIRSRCAGKTVSNWWQGRPIAGL